MDSILDSVKSWGDALGGLADKYLAYRQVETQNALTAAQLRYQQQAAQMAAQQQASTPAWLMPALLVGGGVVLFLALKK